MTGSSAVRSDDAGQDAIRLGRRDSLMAVRHEQGDVCRAKARQDRKELSCRNRVRTSDAGKERPEGAENPSSKKGEEMRKLKDRAVIETLKQLEAQKGILLPEDVVAAAKSKKSPLHDYFTWDDHRAAQEHRLQQARQLISITVEYIGSESHGREQRVFVSLRQDRDQGGYRSLVSVMQSPNLRDSLLQDVLEEMAFFRGKFAELKELAVVFAAMNVAEKRLKRKTRYGRKGQPRGGTVKRVAVRQA